MKTTAFTLESTAQVLIRCFFIGFALQLLWLIWFFAFGQWTYEIHKQWFSRHEFDLIFYCWIAFWELCVFVGFLVPYLAIRMTLHGRNA